MRVSRILIKDSANGQEKVLNFWGFYEDARGEMAVDDKDNVWVFSTRECFNRLLQDIENIGIRLDNSDLELGVSLDSNVWLTGSKLVSTNSGIAYYDHLSLDEHPESEMPH